MPSKIHSSGLSRFAAFTAVCTLLLIGLGGLVTSKGAGMAVPDWPTTYGYNMFFFPISQWVGGIFYEHSHRLLASFVGLLTIVLAVSLFGLRARPFVRWGGFGLIVIAALAFASGRLTRETPYLIAAAGLVAMAASFVWPRGNPASPMLRWLGITAFVVVVLQGVLGGLRVVLYRNELGILHGALAQMFLVLVVAIALLTSPWWQNLVPGGFPAGILGLRRAAAVIGALIFVQLLLGAAMRHQHAGLAVLDFPLAYGRIWPPMDPEFIARINQQRLDPEEANPITAFQIGLHMIHRLSAVVILAAVIVFYALARRRFNPGNTLRRLAGLWLVLIGGQVLLGAATVWSNKAADFATLHVMTGAVSLVVGALLTLIASKFSIVARERAVQSPAVFSRARDALTA